MLIALLGLSLAAAPVDVIATPGGDGGAVKKALQKALPGVTLADESAVWSYLSTKDLLGMQDFQGFSAAPVAGWPAELAETWRTGVAYCRDLAGPPPWKPNAMASNVACANRLAAFLWTKLLEHRGARAVYVVSLSRKKDEVTLNGEVYGPHDRAVLSSREKTSDAGLEQAATQLVAALVARKGEPGSREVVSELSVTQPAGVDLLAAEAVVTDAVPTAKSCAAAPSALEVTPPSVLSRSLSARWAASVKGSAPKAACTLSLGQSEENSMVGTVTVFRATAKCGAVTAAAEGMKSAMAKAPLSARLSEVLVRDLSARFCP